MSKRARKAYHQRRGEKIQLGAIRRCQPLGYGSEALVVRLGRVPLLIGGSYALSHVDSAVVNNSHHRIYLCERGINDMRHCSEKVGIHGAAERIKNGKMRQDQIQKHSGLLAYG
jgi:hypothetical protein